MNDVTAFIDNAFLPAGNGPRLAVIDPATETQVATVEESGAGGVDQAVAAARRAFRDGPWRRMPAVARQAMLRRVADLVRTHADELAELECRNSGIPMRHLARGQIPRAAYNFDFFADVIGQAEGQVYQQDPAVLTVVTRAPVGVGALIGPWNAPLALTSMKIAGCIAFGNSCVVKPAERTPLAVARLMALLAEAGLPPGVVNMVNGTGADTGDALVRHPDVDVVSFTGGTETGRRIMAAAAAGLKPTSMELGGKSANIVFATADLDRALDGALLGIYSNNGQQCLAGSRILVQRQVADEFIARFVARTRRLHIGDPMMPATEIGPLAFREHYERVLGFVDMARGDGADVLVGGGPADLPRGLYMQPTAVLARSNAQRICQEEVFGPFATFVLFDELEEAVAMANESRFGLVSYVWSDHMPTVMRAMRDIEAGIVWVNTPMMRELRAPFGGVKDSGSGREGGAASMRFYTTEKATTLPIEAGPLTQLGMGQAPC